MNWSNVISFSESILSCKKKRVKREEDYNYININVEMEDKCKMITIPINYKYWYRRFVKKRTKICVEYRIS